MQVHSFIAESAADAVSQIRAQLGPQAVVLNVRPIPGDGLSRLWQKRRIEVLAYVPEAPAPPVEPSADALAQLRQELAAIRQKFEGRTPADGLNTLDSTSPIQLAENPSIDSELATKHAAGGGRWRVGTLLENSGLLPMHAQRIVEELRNEHGELPPVALARELELAAVLLRDLWRKKQPAAQLNTGAHVFIGPPGVGKTVCLCKCLAQSVLVEGRKAAVWRLDSRVANTSEALSVYAEILGVPVERCLPPDRAGTLPELLLIDLPGVNWSDAEALSQLGHQLKSLPDPRVHLVLNAAYESSLLLAQVRGFSSLPVSDVIFAHLDEELRWGKVWNVILGTNCTVSVLSAGQNIPGTWLKATPDQVLARQFPGK